MKSILLSFILALFFNYTVSATNYYISVSGSDSNNGSSNSPWRTLAYACSQARTSGDIIHVAAGTYLETSQCALAVGVSIEGQGESSIIQSNISNNYTISLWSNSAGTNGNQHISNIKMDGIYVSKNVCTAYAAIQVYNRSNVEISNCTFTNFQTYGVVFDTYRLNDGVNTAPPNKYSTGNKIHDCTIDNCSAYSAPGDKYNGEGKGAIIANSQDGLLIYNNDLIQTSRDPGYNGYLIKSAGGPGGFLKNVKIYNNIITKAPYDNQTWDFALELWNVMGGCEIYNNIITGSIDFAGWYGVVKDGLSYGAKVYDNSIGISKGGLSGIYFEVYSEDVYIERNKISNVSTGLLFNFYYSDLGPPAAAKNIYIDYNIFDIVSTTVIPGNYPSGFGISLGNSESGSIFDNININNNNFKATSGGAQIYDGIEVCDNMTASNIKIRNNIIQGFSGNAIVGRGGTISSLTIQNNIMYNNGNTIAFSGVSPTNYTNSNNITSNPLFVSSTDYHLQPGSPAIGAGIYIPGLIADLAGNAIGNPPNIGVYDSGTAAPAPEAQIPVYQKSVIENSTPAQMVMTYDLTLANIVPAATSFTVRVNSVARTVRTVSVSGTKVYLNLSSAVVAGDVITVAYTKPASNPLQTAAGGEAASFSISPVTNNVTPVNPPPASLTIKMTIGSNPVHNIIDIVFSYTGTPVSPQILRILDMSGNIFVEKVLDPGVPNIWFPINLNSGVYNVVVLTQGVQMALQKIIVY